MQIALTKKLADAMGADCPSVHKVVDPLFSWTANWTKVWDNRRAEDMLVLVNNATRFTVAIYRVKAYLTDAVAVNFWNNDPCKTHSGFLSSQS
ncbi:MAG: hypothetical protein DDT19_02525 [Syntrophomonadaceae bacterium]|nr:hypothetical protein [Bacillota bacterium]